MDNKTNSHIVGESLAKLYFELQGYFVYTNSSGKAEFDLVLSKDGLLYSAEVKTVSVEKTSIKGTYFDVQLKSVRSNTTENTIHNFDNSFIDYLCIVNITNNTILVLEASGIKVHGSIRIYSDRFKNILAGAEVGSSHDLENHSNT